MSHQDSFRLCELDHAHRELGYPKIFNKNCNKPVVTKFTTEITYKNTNGAIKFLEFFSLQVGIGQILNDVGQKVIQTKLFSRHELFDLVFLVKSQILQGVGIVVSKVITIFVCEKYLQLR